MSGQNDPFCAARLSFKELEDARERSLNYRKVGISIEERQCRTAQGQALLADALNIHLDIDGVAGNQMHEAERAFAHMHNLPCTDCPEFRGRLAQVIDDLIAKRGRAVEGVIERAFACGLQTSPAAKSQPQDVYFWWVNLL